MNKQCINCINQTECQKYNVEYGSKYCNDKYKCTNKKVVLSFVGINTVYQGYQELLKCESYEESKLSKDIKKFLDNIKE